MKRQNLLPMFLVSAAFPCSLARAADIGVVYTFQGYLEDDGVPANGLHDMRFRMYDASSGGTQIGPMLFFNGLVDNPEPIDVVNGLFVAKLDYSLVDPPPIDGRALWLEIDVRPNLVGFYITLSPRIELTPAPHAVRAVGGVGPVNLLEVDPVNSRIGIGTDTPDAKLDVAGSFQVDGTTFNVDSNDNFVGIGTTTPATRLQITGGTDASISSGGYLTVGSTTSTNIVLDDNEIMARDNGASADLTLNLGSGNVGVGTGSPGAKLDVAGTFKVDGTTFNVDPVNNYVGVRTATPAAPLHVAGFAFIDGPMGIATDTPATTLDVNGSFRADVQTLVVDAVNNRVGVGTGVPGVTLDVFGNFEVGDLVNTVLRTDLGNNRVGVGTATPSATLDVAGSLEVDGNTLYVDSTNNRVGIGTTSPNSTLEVVGSLRADTNTFFVDSANDRVGVGTLTPSAALDVVGSLEVDGTTLYVNSTSNRVGIGTASPTEALHVVGDACVTGTIGVCSDRRYKSDITTIDDAMTLIDRVRGVHFNWRRDEFPDHQFSDKPQIGFIAQEVAEVLPEVVMRDDDGYYWVDYGRLTPVLVEAIKEQARSLDEQKRSIDSKDRQLAALADRIERLERAMDDNKEFIRD